MLRYPSAETAELMPAASEVIKGEKLLPTRLVRQLVRLALQLGQDDLYEVQARYVDLFDRTRSLSLQLYEHVHGESRDRGQAMVELLKLYSSRGMELTANELPDHLPVFMEFLSMLPDGEAADLLGQASHVLEALRERLRKRDAAYACVFEALIALTDADHDHEALQALLREPDDDPSDLAALDRAWADAPVSFSPEDTGCLRAGAMLARMKESAA
jgi:nitrate reductase delta subunit